MAEDHKSGPDDPVSFAIANAAKALISAGCQLVKLKPDEKLPASQRGWQNSAPDATAFMDGSNVGVQLGPKSGHLIDIDLDCPEARALAALSCFFPDLPSFGRSSLAPDAPGHRLVVCKDAPDQRIALGFTKPAEIAIAKDIGFDKSVMLEIRAGKGYTVFPPSSIGGDKLVWRRPLTMPIPTMTWEDLEKRARLLAFCSFAAACYPQQGSRNDFCLLLAGVLIQFDVEPDIAEEIIEAIVEIGRDNPRDRRGMAIATAQKKAAGEKVTGLPAFLDHIGFEALESTIRSWLRLPDASSGQAASTDRIQIDRHDIHVSVAMTDRLLVEKSGKVFRRNGELVRLKRLDEPVTDHGVARSAGSVQLAPVSPMWLGNEASRVGGSFWAFKRTGNSRVSPPDWFMARLIANADDSALPILTGFSLTPSLYRDDPGYDPRTGIYLDFAPGAFPAAIEPTREAALRALDMLERPLRGFPFADPASRSTALGAMLSAVIRPELRTCPAIIVDAPSAGTGKTLFGQMVGALALGTPPPSISYATRQEENEKRLSALLRGGDPVLMIDNVSCELEGDFLCQMLTSDSVRARILGQSETVTLSTRTLVIVTGNNVHASGDMSRRAVKVRLDAGMANPDERRFDFNPVEEVRAQRPILVRAALTILRAYIAAGRPVTNLPAFGSFEDWDLVRGALVWLGLPDPALTRSAVKQSTVELEQRTELMVALLQFFTIGQPFTVNQIGTSPQYKELSDKLLPMIGGAWDGQRVGYLLRRFKDVPILGVILRDRGSPANVREWWLEGEPEAGLAEYLDKVTGGEPM